MSNVKCLMTMSNFFMSYATVTVTITDTGADTVTVTVTVTITELSKQPLSQKLLNMFRKLLSYRVVKISI